MAMKSPLVFYEFYECYNKIYFLRAYIEKIDIPIMDAAVKLFRRRDLYIEPCEFFFIWDDMTHDSLYRGK